MSANNTSGMPRVSNRLAFNAMRNWKEKLIEGLLLTAATISVLTTLGIVYVLLSESFHFFQNVSIVDFLTDTQWTPLFDDAHFGIMVLISGTVVSSAVALAVAIPMGTVIAIYLSEFAKPKVREIAKPVLELLGGIPTIVFGYFALLMVTPLLQKIFPELPGFSLLSAGLVMGIMIVPYIASLSEDAMRAVPMSLREGAYAMGSTRFQTAVKVVFPWSMCPIVPTFKCGLLRSYFSFAIFHSPFVDRKEIHSND